MKKFFSLIALVGVFAACQPETISTTFDPDSAEATVYMTATDLESGDDVTSQTTFTSTLGSVSGNKITIVGNPDITATTFKVTAKYGNGSWTEEYPINALAAGGKATYKYGITVGEIKPVNAQAFITVSVWDVRAEKEVTSEVKIESSLGTVTNNLVYIEGNPTITSQNVKIKVTPKDCDPVEYNVKIDDIAAGQTKDYSVKIEVGKDKPVIKNAQAYIKVKVVNKADGKNVTNFATVTTSKGEYNNGIVTLTGDPALSSTIVIISAKYGDFHEASSNIHINDLAAGQEAYYSLTITVGEEVAYTLQYIKGETTINENMHYTLTTATHAGHASAEDPHAYSHDGHSPSSWLLNNTEMTLLLKTTYTAGYGNFISYSSYKDVTPDELRLIYAYQNALAKPELKVEELTYSFKVSAWAYYNCVQTVYSANTKYDVKRIGTDGSEVDVCSFTLTNMSCSIEAVEYAANSHYIYGHGVGHSTHDEHGSENAGGGICYGD